MSEPFATIADLKARWPEMPPGLEATARTLLVDAQDFMLAACPTASTATPLTRRRIACAIVKRALTAADAVPVGVERFTEQTGPFSHSYQAANPHGDLYLTKAEKSQLGGGKTSVSSMYIGQRHSPHLPWCSLMFAATYCSCGVDLAGEPLYEQDAAHDHR